MTTQLAHAAPLSAIDRVLALDERGIRISRTLDAHEAYFAGHYPGHPIFPGVFILEAVHQATHRYAERYGPSEVRLRLAHIRSMRFLSALRPGDHLEVDCRCAFADDGRALDVDAGCLREGHAPAARFKLRYDLERPSPIQAEPDRT